jgi:hypothetical protein
MNQMNTEQNNLFRQQLEQLRKPCMVLDFDYSKAEPLQLPIQPQHPVSAAKQAFLDMANGPVMNLDDLNISECNYDSDPEILLSDSDEEDEPIMAMEEGSEADADTAIDTNEVLSSCGSDMDFSNEDFDETLPSSVPSFNTFLFESNSDVSNDKSDLAFEGASVMAHMHRSLSKAQ